MPRTRSVEFFGAQCRQAAAGRFVLNPFEARALPFISGRVLDRFRAWIARRPDSGR